MKVIYNGRVVEEKGKLVADSLPTDFDDVVTYQSKSDFPATGERGRIYFEDEEGLPYLWNAAQNNYIPLRVDNDGGEF
jgi:hypothetical protein